ncbi:hypothetical protein FQR65_LT11510 [Abscondita terminalis]|nr:hypothetical protein FQR65_LT11510 [Abscondita terminalis]
MYGKIRLNNLVINNLNKTLNATENTISEKCKNHLLEFMRDVNTEKIWALKMMDSGSGLPSGMLEGNNEDLGSFDECINVSKFISETDFILGKYCLGEIILSSLEEITGDNNTINMKLASCFPDSCSTKDIKILYKSVSLNVTLDENNCQTKNDQPRMDARLIGGITFFITVAALLFLSTTYEIVYLIFKKDCKYEVLKAFSLYTNVGKIFGTGDGNSREILCINGIRVLSMFWIILDHRLSVQASFPMTNLFNSKSWLNNPLNMIFINGQLAVDTFFLMSGTVITYSYKMSLGQTKNLNVFQYIFHRYLRLTPAIVGVIIFIVTVLKHLGSGPFWPSTMEHLFIRGCKNYWWKTLLYIQNYGREKEMCIPHGWYLSTDFQLFLVSPIILILYKKSVKLAASIVGIALLCNVVACFLIGWFFELNALIVGNLGFEKNMEFVWQFHFPAYTRASTWLIGLILGHLLYESRIKEIELRKSVVISFWLVCSITISACLFGGNNLISGEYNKLVNSLHMALVRPSWGIAVSWIIFACANGYAGPVNTFLSMYAFKVLAKLTYSTYLIHYIVIYILATPIRTAAPFTNVQTICAFCGDLIFSCIAAMILCVSFESPVIILEKHFLKKRSEFLPKNNQNDIVGTSLEYPPSTSVSTITLTSAGVNEKNVVRSTKIKIDKLPCKIV